MIDDLEDVKGTSYFEEDLDEAKGAVDAVVKQYHDLVAEAPSTDEGESLRTRFALPIRGLTDKMEAEILAASH